MREIKFRAWNEINSTMLQPKDLCDLDGLTSQNVNSDFLLLQYTGLKDKNGVEIYEGDILAWVSSNPFSLGDKRTVQVNYIEARFWCYGTAVGVYLGELLSEENCRVIGNIYENPELLQKGGVTA